jgi:hypothetical protein
MQEEAAHGREADNAKQEQQAAEDRGAAAAAAAAARAADEEEEEDVVNSSRQEMSWVSTSTTFAYTPWPVQLAHVGCLYCSRVITQLPIRDGHSRRADVTAAQAPGQVASHHRQAGQPSGSRMQNSHGLSVQPISGAEHRAASPTVLPNGHAQSKPGRHGTGGSDSGSNSPDRGPVGDE